MSFLSSITGSFSGTPQNSSGQNASGPNVGSRTDDRKILKGNKLRPKLTRKIDARRPDSFDYAQEDGEFASGASGDTGSFVDTVPPEESFRTSHYGSPSSRTFSLSNRDPNKMKELSIPSSPSSSSSLSSPSDSKSRDNILYLAKSFRSRPSILPPKTPTSSSSSGYSSSMKITYRYDYSTKHLPVKLPKPRKIIISKTRKNCCNTINIFAKNGTYYTDNITVDNRDGKGYGRRIKIPPNIDKNIFLNYKQGVVISLKRKKNELLRLSQKDKSVCKLIEKFKSLSPEDYDHMIIHQFGLEKIYSISDSVLQEYNPNPGKNSPYRNLNA